MELIIKYVYFITLISVASIVAVIIILERFTKGKKKG